MTHDVCASLNCIFISSRCRWDNLDIDALAAEFGAESITKNGPQYWSMDTVSVKGSDERFDMSGADSEFFAALLILQDMHTTLYTCLGLRRVKDRVGGRADRARGEVGPEDH